MKKTLSLFLVSISLFLVSCSKKNSDPNSDTNIGPNSEYANYDFFISAKGCSQIDEFTKNFKPFGNFDKAENFTISGSNIYSYGTKKYRNESPNSGTYITGSNYGGYLNKNGSVLYSDLGGISNAVIDAQESQSNIYLITGYAFLDGGMSVDQAVKALPPTKIYKNGTEFGSLSGPFVNTYLTNTGPISSNKSLINVSDLIIKGSDIYISGFCSKYSDYYEKSYGYWKNLVYNEVARIYANTPNGLKLIVRDNGDVYYGFGYNSNIRLYKNSVALTNWTLNGPAFRDFDILNDDVYLLANYYDNNDNNYKLGIYKNGILDYKTIDANAYDTHKIHVVDNRIFICAYGLQSEYKIAVYEYKPTTKTLTKVGNTMSDLNCTNVNILDFFVKKK